MNKSVWDLYAPIYEKAMRMDQKYYRYMYDRIPVLIQDKVVLEIATGPGLLAKHIAYAAKSIIATDYSEGMIKEARKGIYAKNLSFGVADAINLPYADGSFDVVIIANAFHRKSRTSSIRNKSRTSIKRNFDCTKFCRT